MNRRQKRQWLCFTIEGLNSFVTALYFNYFYFFLRSRFGFDDKANLVAAALLGLCYALFSWQAGRLAHRWGYFTALKLGFGIMAAGLLVGAQLGSAAGQIAAAAVVSLGMSFTWPVLEALISENETPARVPHAVGIYNITWAATNALAYFIGGTLIVKFGFHSIFYAPMVILLVQLALTVWLEALAKTHSRHVAETVVRPPPDPNRPSPAKAKTFLRMAWLANPFAYIAINTLIAVIPGLAARFELSPMMAGFICSLWCFVRLGVFFVLWFWTGWHYRFRWLATAFALLILAFTAILVAPNLAVLIVAQIFFGAAIGLIYYSSLFYSMDVGETKSEHGGIHEAAIGAGNCIGPAVGAAALQFAAQSPNAGAYAVSALLLGGFGGLVKIWKAGRGN
ncbi:MAG: MFS transporter [Verrucomicrobiales bacterium]|nr:MFS transporter [Verrucomicrobiales bacterium]